MERSSSAACELAASIVPGGKEGLGDAIAFEVVVAIVGDCRRDMGRDIRPTEESCKD